MLRRLLPLAILCVATAFSPRVAFDVSKSTSSRRYLPPSPVQQRQQHGRITHQPLVQQQAVEESPQTSEQSGVAAIYEAFRFTEYSLTYEKVFNGLFLLACFGYALYAILNIDHGMTRGWTPEEIAMRIPLDNWSSYEAALLEKPIVTKTVINVIIYLLGDWLSQTLFSQKHVLDFDVKRTLRNGFIGLCFGPLVHEYYEFSDRILPVEGGIINRGSKILMDQTIYLTVKCSMYIAAVGLLSGDSPQKCKETVQQRIGPVVITAWKFWPLVHCITYGLIPARHRILWVNCVDLVWNAILASKARAQEPDDDAIDVEQNMMEHGKPLQVDMEDEAVEQVKGLESASVLVDTLSNGKKDDDETRMDTTTLDAKELAVDVLPLEDLSNTNLTANFTASGLTQTA